MPVELADSDYDACIIKDPSDSVMLRMQHQPEDKWQPPPSPMEKFEKSAGGGGNVLEVTQRWDDLRVKLRENLLERLITVARQLRDAALAGLQGDIANALQTFARALEDLLADTDRILIVTWKFEFELEPAVKTHSLLIEHSNTFVADIRKTDGLAKERMSWSIESTVTLERPLLNARLYAERSHQSGNLVDTINRMDVTSTRGGHKTVECMSKIFLRADSFRDDIEDFLKKIVELIQQLANLEEAIEEYIKSWAWWTTSDASKVAEREAERARRRDSIGRSARETISSLVEMLDKLIKVWSGDISINSSKLVISCLSGSGAEKVRGLIGREQPSLPRGTGPVEPSSPAPTQLEAEGKALGLLRQLGIEDLLAEGRLMSSAELRKLVSARAKRSDLDVLVPGWREARARASREEAAKRTRKVVEDFDDS
jgi:hypothetical protein